MGDFPCVRTFGTVPGGLQKNVITAGTIGLGEAWKTPSNRASETLGAILGTGEGITASTAGCVFGKRRGEGWRNVEVATDNSLITSLARDQFDSSAALNRSGHYSVSVRVGEELYIKVFKDNRDFWGDSDFQCHACLSPG